MNEPTGYKLILKSSCKLTYHQLSCIQQIHQIIKKLKMDDVEDEFGIDEELIELKKRYNVYINPVRTALVGEKR